ncbi:uncharacterized protein BJ212DRAFT_730613 [Suillus subaureus]|uniref:Uncharacterized protein n=1 Tax=Suillus subaureus TaxID=48587 RepID=A0A9P7J8E9_9AGAM|nr:uncharacterized protein BJ212DRAFT_730613 [Suillus subaureus]KAG1807851.1 hypothetical protein BJ212DRAFT_730613 [Suillus subaureus]
MLLTSRRLSDRLSSLAVLLAPKIENVIVDTGVKVSFLYGATEFWDITCFFWSKYYGTGCDLDQTLRSVPTHHVSADNLSDVKGYVSSDVFIKHPTVEGRIDDVSVTAPIESTITADPYVNGHCIMTKSGFQSLGMKFVVARCRRSESGGSCFQQDPRGDDSCDMQCIAHAASWKENCQDTKRWRAAPEQALMCLCLRTGLRMTLRAGSMLMAYAAAVNATNVVDTFLLKALTGGSRAN